MKRVVLDTNILVSSVLGGTLEFVMNKWLEGKLTLIVSDDIIGEYVDVLNRPKLHLGQETIDRITAYLVQQAEYVLPEEQIQLIESDPSDNKFIEAAVAGKVDCIVSGDNHLLEIKSYRSIPILTAREFLRWLETT